MGSIIQLFRSKQKQGRSAKEAFESLVGPHIELMYGMAYRWTQSQEDAEDLVQDVLIKLADKVEEMQRVEALKPWIIKILYRRFVDLYRKGKASPVVNLHVVDEDDTPSHPENWLTSPSEESKLALQQTLLEALNALDDDQKDVAILHFMEGYTALEAAEILGINEGTAKSRLQRARTKLKKVLSSGPF